MKIFVQLNHLPESWGQKFLPKNVQKNNHQQNQPLQAEAMQPKNAKNIPMQIRFIEKHHSEITPRGEPKKPKINPPGFFPKPAPLFSARPFGPWSPEFGGFKKLLQKKKAFESFVGMGHPPPPRKINISHPYLLKKGLFLKDMSYFTHHFSGVCEFCSNFWLLFASDAS